MASEIRLKIEIMKNYVTFHLLGVPVEMIKARKISGIFMVIVVGRFL